MQTARLTIILMALVLSSAFTGAALGAKHETPTANTPTPPTGQWFDYVLTIMLENHSINFTYYNGGSINSCIGNCTYYTSLANTNGLAEGLTNAGVNASAASYIAITSALNAPQACNNAPNASGCPYFTNPDIVDSLDKNGLTWKAYMEGYPQPPSGCFTGYNSGDPYYYTPIHDPFLYYADIANNNTRCARIVAANSHPVTQNSTGCWPTALQNDDVLLKDLNSVTNASNYMFLTPNTVDQAHDCNDVSAGNAWMNEMIPQILTSTLFKTKRAALFITFDEPGCTNPSGQPACPSGASPDLYSVWASNPSNPTTKTAFKSTQTYTLYSPLKAVEVNWNLPTLTMSDANSNSMSEFFQIPLTTSFTPTPSSPVPGQQVTFTATVSGGTGPYSYNWRFGDGATSTTNPASHAYSSAGSYNVQLTVTDKTGATKNATQTLVVGPDFTLSSSLSSLTLHAGTTNSTTINLSNINSFAGTVSLTTTVSPAGLTTSFSPPSVSLTSGGNGASTLTVSSATVGTYTVNVTGTNGPLAHKTTVTVSVIIPDFTISSSPTSLTIPQSATGTSAISLTSLLQFSGTVTLTTSITPSGLTASLSPPSITLPSGGSGTSTLTVTSTNLGSYSVKVIGTSGTLSHSTTVTVTVAYTSTLVASDSATGPTSLYPTGEKLIQDSAGKMIAVYIDSSGRIGLSYANSEPVLTGWSTPVKSPTPVSSYTWPAAVLVSPTLLHIMTGGGSGIGEITDIPVTITRNAQNNITGFIFGTPTTLDTSGLARYPTAILVHNGDILLAWAWQNTTSSIVKSLRWDATTGWTNISGSSTTPDNILVDNSVIQWFVPNLIERPDNHNLYLFADKLVNSGRIAFDKASWNGSSWSWGSLPNFTYETNASDADDDAISLTWDPARSLVVAAYGISGTHTYGVFTLTAQDLKTHIDTPTLAVTGDRGWGGIAVQTLTGDYVLFLISVSGDAGSGPLGYIQMPAGGSWNATITWLNSATDDQVTNLRTVGPNPALDLLYVEGTSAPAQVKFLRLYPPGFTFAASSNIVMTQTGNPGTSTITISSLNNLAGTVSLSTTVSPSGPSVSLNPASVTLLGGGTATSTLTLNSTTPGTYIVTILATRGSISHSLTVTFNVTSSLNLTANPTGVTILAGAAGTSTINVSNPVGGTTSLAATLSPTSGLTCSLNPTSVTGTSGSSTLSCSGSAGVYTVTVTGTHGTITAQTMVTFTVQDFTLSAPAITATANTAGTSQVTVNAINGFAGTVTFSLTSTAPASCTQSISATGLVTVNCTTGVAPFTVTAQGVSAAITRTVGVLVTVQDFTLSAPAITTTANTAGTSQAAVSAINGFAGVVTFSLTSAAPAGCTQSISAAGLITVTCTTGLTPFTVTAQGVSGSITRTVGVLVTVQDFTLSAPPITTTANTAGTSQATFNAINWFAGTVTFSLTSTAPAGCTQSISVSGLLSVTCSSGVAPFTVTIQGASGSITRTVGVLVTVQDFTLSAPAITTTANMAGTSQVAVNAVNGFAGTVTFSITSTALAGCTQSVSATGLLSVSCTTGVAPFTVTVQGVSGSITRTVGILVMVEDFTLSAPAITTIANAAGTSQITVNVINGFTGTVTYSLTSAAPAGCTESVSAVGLVTVNCTTGLAPFTVTAQGVSGSITRTVGVLVTVQDFTLSAAAITTTSNTAGTSQVTVNGINGFLGTVTFSLASTLPAGCTQSISASGLLSVTCTNGVTPFTVTVQGVNAAITRTVGVLVTIQDFTLSAPAITTTANTAGTSQVAVNAINGFAGTVTFSLTSTAPAGCIQSVSATGLASVTCTSGVAPFTVTAQGFSGSITRTVGILVTVQDFTLSAPATSALATVAGTSQVTVNAINGFAGTVTFSLTSSAPTGCTQSISTAGLVSVTCSTGVVPFTVTAQGVSGPITRIVGILVTVQDFGITASPATVTANVGSAGASTIAINEVQGPYTVNLATNSTSCTISPTSVGTSGGAVLTCTFNSVGTVHVTTTGTAGGLSHAATATYAVQDFTVAANPTTVNANLGAVATSTVTITGLNGFAGFVSLATNSTSCALSPTSVTGSGNSTLSCTFASASTVHVTVIGLNGSLSHSATATFTVQDFTIAASPASVTVNAGTATTYTITINGVNGLASVVNLATNSTACTLTPTSVTGSGSSTLSCTFASALTVHVTVSGVSGSLSHSTTATFIVQDFTVAAGPTSITDNAGTSAASTVTVTGLNGFASVVGLVSNNPSCTLTQTSLTGSWNSTLLCTFASAGTVLVTVTGKSGSLSHSATVTYVVQDFTIAASPTSVTVNAGTAGTSTIGITGLNGFTGIVSLATNSTSCTLSPNSLTGTGSSTSSCTFAYAGIFHVTVTGTSGSLSHSVTVTYTDQDFTITSNPTSVNVNVNSAGNTTISVSGLNGFPGLVSLTTNSTSCVVSPTSVAGSVSAQMSCIFASASTIRVGITGASASLSHSATITFIVQDFTTTSTPSSIVVSQGSAGTSTISITSLNGFSGGVSFATNSTGCTLSPTSITGSGNSTLSCLFPIVGTFHVGVTATSTSLSHPAGVTFNVQDFTLGVSPTSLAVNVGATSTSSLTVNGLIGFAGLVGLVTNSTACAVSPAIVSGSGSAVLSCNFATAITLHVMVTGTSGSLSHSAVVTYAVQDFTISTAAPLPANVSSSTGSTITLTGLNQFAGTVSLTDTVQAGLTCGLITPTTLSGSGTATVSCTANNAGNYTLTVTGTSTNLVHTASSTFTFRDYAFVASSPAAANTGTPIVATITLTSLNGFSATASLTDTVPSGLTCWTITPPILTGSGNATVSCNSSTAGNYNLTLTGTSGSLTHSATAMFVFRDFAISASLPMAANVGSSSTPTINVTSLNQFAGTVTLSDTVPSGLTCGAISPISIAGSGSATVSCLATLAGNYTLTVTSSSSSLSHIANAIFRFVDYSIAATTPAAVTAGAPATSTITIASLNNFIGIVNLSDTASSGLSCGAISPGSVTGSGVATVSCSSNVAGNYTLTVSGTNGGLSHSASTFVSVQDYTITSSSTNTKVNAGSTSSAIVSISSLNNFSGTVTLSASGTLGLDTTVSPGTLAGGSGTAIVTFSSGTAGNYTATVTSSIGSLTHTATIIIQVVDFAVTASPTSLTILSGTSGNSMVAATSLNGFNGIATLTLTQSMGLIATVSPASIAAPGISTLTVSGSLPGDYSVTITGKSGSLSHTITVIVHVADYSLAGSPVNLVAPIGSSTGSTLTLQSVNGYSGNVTLTFAVQASSTISPPGGGTGGGRPFIMAPPTILPSISISPGSFQLFSGGTQQSTVSVLLPGNLLSGSYLITVTASDGALSHTTVLAILATDFSMAATSNSVSLPTGSNTTITLNLQSLNFFHGGVTLALTGSNGGPTGTLSTSSLQLITNSNVNLNLTIQVPLSAAAGNYTIVVQAQSGTISHSLSISVTVRAGFATILIELLSPHNSVSISAIAIFSLFTIFGTLEFRRYQRQKPSPYRRRIEKHILHRPASSRSLSYWPSVPLLWGPESRDDF